MLKQTTLTALSLMMISCGGRDLTETSKFLAVGTTSVFISEGAERYPIERFVVELWKVMASFHGGSEKADEIMDVNLYMLPVDEEIHLAQVQGEVRGYYSKVDRTIVVVSERDWVFDVLMHEFVQHRLPHVLSGESNSDHSDAWFDHDLKLRSWMPEELK